MNQNKTIKKPDPNDKVKARISSEEDFIYCPRLSNSLSKFLEIHSEGVENDKIAKVLMLSEEEVEQIFASALTKLRAFLDDSNKEENEDGEEDLD